MARPHPVFALVHGAWHTGACWAPLAAELERRGARTFAPDLPCDAPASGASEYADAVCAALEGIGEPVILVGHSLGGLTIPVVAQRRETAMMVFLCALLPRPGDSLAGQRVGEPDMMTERWRSEYLPHRQVLDGGATRWPDDLAEEVFYHDCPEGLLGSALAALRPQAAAPIEEITPLREWPSVPSAYILAADDRVVDADWARRAVPERLGIVPEEMPGGHSPFVSRPVELADRLLRICARVFD